MKTNWKGLKMPNLVVVTAKFTPNLAVWTDLNQAAKVSFKKSESEEKRNSLFEENLKKNLKKLLKS